jgi:hypothetical protein
MWILGKNKICEFLLDAPHARVHFDGFRDRPASFWTEIVARDATNYQEAVQKEMLYKK